MVLNCLGARINSSLTLISRVTGTILWNLLRISVLICKWILADLVMFYFVIVLLLLFWRGKGFHEWDSILNIFRCPPLESSHNNSIGRYYYYVHLPDEKAEAQRVSMKWPKSREAGAQTWQPASLRNLETLHHKAERKVTSQWIWDVVIMFLSAV